MFKLTLPLLAITALSGCASITSEPALFNGTNLDGWYAFDDKQGKLEQAEDRFTVENGMIRLFGKSKAYLASVKSYDEFELSLEYKWNLDENFARISNKKNSGIMYLFPSDTPDMFWPKGIQFQVKEGSSGDFIMLHNTTVKINGKSSEPGKSVVLKHFSDASNPLGEWNQVDIKVKNGQITQKLNGTVVNQATDANVSSGKILLQFEGYPIDFKNLVIKRL